MTGAQMRDAALKWMLAQVGRHEEPVGSNHIFVWDDMFPSYQGQPWCMGTVMDSYYHGGVDLRRLFPSGGAFYCPTVEQLAKSNGFWKTSGQVAGDIVIYGEGGIATHTGLAYPDAAVGLYRAVEGNTSADDAGSQVNGDGIYVKRRTRTFIRGWIDGAKIADYAIARGFAVQNPPMTKPAPPVNSSLAPFPLPSGHWFGPVSSDNRNHSGTGNPDDQKSIRLIQKTVGIAQDGIYGPVTKSKVYYAQTLRGVSADGLVGAVTWKALAIRY